MTHPCSKEDEIKEIRDIAIRTDTRFEFIQQELSDIKTNHLAHMQVCLENLAQKQVDDMEKNEQNVASSLKPIGIRIDKLEKLSYKIVVWALVLGTIAGLAIQLIFKYS